MPPTGYPSQSDVFYDYYWTEYIDLSFVIKLEHEATRLGHPLTINNVVSIERARRDVNLQYKKIFSEAYCLKRFEKLVDRFNTFSEIIAMPEVVYNRVTNVVHAHEHDWDKICMNKELGVAYREKGDPCWEYLQRIFGTNSTNNSRDRNSIINLSSDNSESQPRTHALFANSHSANSVTPRRRNSFVSGASSTGRSVFSTSSRRTNDSGGLGGDEEPSSQASCSWLDLSK